LHDRQKFLNDSALVINQDAALRTAGSAIMLSVFHIGIHSNLFDQLKRVELNFEGGQKVSRSVSGAKSFANVQDPWLSFVVDRVPKGTRLFQISLVYDDKGASKELTGVALVLNLEQNSEKFYRLTKASARGGLRIFEVDLERPWTESYSQETQVDQTVEFFFEKMPSQSVSGVLKKRTFDWSDSVFQSDAFKGSNFRENIKTLVREGRYSLALSLINVCLASVNIQGFEERMSLYLIKSLLEATIGEHQAALKSFYHSEAMFRGAVSNDPNQWALLQSRLYFSLAVLRSDLLHMGILQ